MPEVHKSTVQTNNSDSQAKKNSNKKKSKKEKIKKFITEKVIHDGKSSRFIAILIIIIIIIIIALIIILPLYQLLTSINFDLNLNQNSEVTEDLPPPNSIESPPNPNILGPPPEVQLEDIPQAEETIDEPVF